MKILVTGCTAQQVGHGNRLGYEPVVDLYVKALRDLGHTVEHRSPTWKDDGLGYDRVLVGLVPAGSLAASYLNRALPLLDRAWKKSFLYVDDWGFTMIINQMRSVLRKLKGPTQVKPSIAVGRALEAKGAVTRALERLAQEPWPVTLFPRYAWGSDALGAQLPTVRREFLDPSGYARDHRVELTRPNRRRRTWVLGCVSDQRKWLGSLRLTWPVEHFGGKASKAAMSLTEGQLVQRYAESWGVLSPFYPRLAGTGWWRNRFVYAAQAGAILLGDPRETPLEAYRLTAGDTERADLEGLGRMAAAQAGELWARSWGKRNLTAAFERILA